MQVVAINRIFGNSGREFDKRVSKHEWVSAIYPWGNKRGYDHCINTSGTSIEKIIPALKQFVTTWFKEHTHGN